MNTEGTIKITTEFRDGPLHFTKRSHPKAGPIERFRAPAVQKGAKSNLDEGGHLEKLHGGDRIGDGPRSTHSVAHRGEDTPDGKLPACSKGSHTRGPILPASSPDSPRDAPTRQRMPLPRNRFRHSGAALQCRDPGPAQPQGGGAAPSSRTGLCEPLPARSLPRPRRRRRRQRPERGAGEGAEPGRSGDGGGPGGGGRCGSGGGAGYPLAPARTRGRESGFRAASLKVLRVRLRPAHNLGHGPGTRWFRVRRREKTRGPGGDRRAAEAEGKQDAAPVWAPFPPPRGRAELQRPSPTGRWKGRLWKSKTPKSRGVAPV
ncbi:unnamed protein product, partial [Rangifer tarandus platyrhynchus]